MPDLAPLNIVSSGICLRVLHQQAECHSVNLFPISSSSLPAENTAGSVIMDRRLDLGVGEEGIIGRVISVVIDGGSESEGMLLGEGVIGWN
jgi:hypothetical protein